MHWLFKSGNPLLVYFAISCMLINRLCMYQAILEFWQSLLTYMNNIPNSSMQRTSKVKIEMWHLKMLQSLLQLGLNVSHLSWNYHHSYSLFLSLLLKSIDQDEWFTQALQGNLNHAWLESCYIFVQLEKSNFNLNTAEWKP